MNISAALWNRYIGRLRKVNDHAADLVREFLSERGVPETQTAMNALIDYAFGVSTTHSEAAAAIAAEMYDTLAELSGVSLPPALPAPVPVVSEVAKAVVGTAKTGNEEIISSSIGRLVKRTGVDTTMQNAIRDKAEWAWIPSGETCAFCIALASRGWQPASRKALAGGHAEHIHANCDCTYAIRFDNRSNVQGYDPDKYREMYENAAGSDSQEKINSMRREFYAENSKEINEQKRDSYAKRVERESPEAEEKSVSDFEYAHYKDKSESGRLVKADGSIINLEGEGDNVVGDKSLLDEMEGGTFTHNHPRNVTFSTKDIANGITKGNLKELRAVTPEGNVHILTNKGASLEERRKFNALYSQAEMKFDNIANKKYSRGEMPYSSKEQYVSTRKEQWLAENASKYNLNYRKTKLYK